jgi:hypothetical protein
MIGASAHPARPSRSLGQEKGGRAAAYPDVITVASHTKKGNPAGLPSWPSSPSTAPNRPYILTRSAAGHQVLAFEPPRVISWKPGYVSPATGKLEFGGWIWRYDLTQLGPDETKVTLSYDWSAVGPVSRQRIQFPPFTPDHLDNSLSHLAAIVAR